MRSKLNLFLLISLILSLSFNVMYYTKESLPIQNDTIKEVCTYESTPEQITVFIAPYGRRFHYDANCAGRNAMKIDLQEVKDVFPHCKICT